MNFQKLLKFSTPILLFLLIAPWTPQIDLFVSKLFFNEATQSFSKHPIFVFIYHFAIFPALIVGGVAAIFFTLSFLNEKFHSYRLPSLFLTLVILIGPGIIINLLLKEFCVRPRPRQTICFGGLNSFVPFYSSGFSLSNHFKSFPSGHSSMGFYFFSLFFLGMRLKKSALKNWGIILTILLGGALGLSRIAQGGHFFSDVLTSSFILWYVSMGSDWIVFDYLAKNRLLRYYKK